MKRDGIGLAFGLPAVVKHEGTAVFFDEPVADVPDDSARETWRDLLDVEIIKVEGAPKRIVHVTGSLASVPDYGDIRWTAWTDNRVYFPAAYDCSFWVASVPRNPCDEQVQAVGGGIE